MAPDLTPEQRRRLHIAYGVMGVLGAIAAAAALLEPFGRYTVVYVLLGCAAITIPVHGVAVSIRRSKRKADEARRVREERYLDDAELVPAQRDKAQPL